MNKKGSRFTDMLVLSTLVTTGTVFVVAFDVALYELALPYTWQVLFQD